MDQTEKHKSWDLIAKYLARETNQAESRIIEEMLSSDDAFESEFESDKNTWDEATYAMHYQSIDNKKAFEKVNMRIHDNEINKKFKPKHLWLFASAASLLLIVGLTIALFEAGPFKRSSNSQTFASDNTVKTLLLNDGTNVDLNRKSAIEYPSVFPTHSRTVKLTGEAFFNVASDKTKPFSVYTDDVVIQVVGTAFNIRAYPEENTIEVVVKHGVVKVLMEPSSMLLHAGEKALYNRINGTLEKSINTDDNFHAWKTGLIEFRETPMLTVVKTIEAVYGVKVKILDKRIEDFRLTGKFDHASVDQVMQLIGKTFHLNYELKGDTCIISASR